MNQNVEIVKKSIINEMDIQFKLLATAQMCNMDYKYGKGLTF